jgi:hypothetical protein
MIPLAIVGAILLATGRPLRAGFPPGTREGSSLRMFGLLWLTVGAGLSILVSRNGASWDSVITLYLFVGAGVLTLRQRSRRANSPRG